MLTLQSFAEFEQWRARVAHLTFDCWAIYSRSEYSFVRLSSRLVGQLLQGRNRRDWGSPLMRLQTGKFSPSRWIKLVNNKNRPKLLQKVTDVDLKQSSCAVAHEQDRPWVSNLLSLQELLSHNQNGCAQLVFWISRFFLNNHKISVSTASHFGSETINPLNVGFFSFWKLHFRSVHYTTKLK